MLDSVIVGKLVNDISYELDLEYYGKSHGSVINIHKLKEWYDKTEQDHKKLFDEDPNIHKEAIRMMEELAAIIKEEDDKLIMGIPPSELRSLYGEFMSGKLNPKFKEYNKKQQRFLLEDSELCETTGITALEVAEQTRTRRFIDLMIVKYKPADTNELRSLFDEAEI